MNRTVNKSIAAILLAIICAFMPISAAEAVTEKTQRLVSEETMYSYTIKNTAWEFKSATAERSANKAIGDAKFIRKALLIVVDTIEPHVVLTCDNNGNFS